MSKVVIYQDADDNAVIVHPSPSLIARMGGIDAAIAHMQSRADCVPPTATSVSVRGKAEIPMDWTFRGAWKPDLTVDMPKAREIHMNRIRVARDEALIEADAEVKKAEDAGDATKLAAERAKRQTLRDIPQTFDLSGAKDPEELKALWPAELDDKKPQALRRP